MWKHGFALSEQTYRPSAANWGASTGVNQWSAKPPSPFKRGRLILVGLLFGISFFAIGMRLVDLTVLKEAAFSPAPFSLSEGRMNRANILDRNGVLLATSVTTASLYADARLVTDGKRIAKKLVNVLPGLNESKMARRLNSGKAFVWLARHLTPKQQEKILRLGEHSLDFQREEKRFYPHGALCAHVLGMTDVDGRGIAGLEKSFESQLAQDPVTLSNPLDDRVQDVTFQEAALHTSLDVRIQSALHKQLIWAMEKFSTKSANGLVMDLATGEILAMASLPDYNLNSDKGLLPKEAYFNRNTLGVYEMGSTFKILNTALVLETGVAKLESLYDATKALKVGRFRITDYRGKNQWLTVSQAFVHSSNIASGQMALDAGIPAQKAFMKGLGLLDSASLEIPEIGRPMSPRNWREPNAITISYGYGMSVSPLQLMDAVAKVVAPDGAAKPTLLKRSESPRERTRGVSEKTADKIRKLMRYSVLRGKNSKAKVNGYVVSGKTGTSMTLKNGRYQEGQVTTSFMGIIGTTVDNPKYLVFVMMEEPKAIKETFGFNAAGWNAAPLAGRVMGDVASLMGLPPSQEQDQAVPDLPGLEIRHAKY
ncbi:MAG: penicillin-binding protein 2 [bacterium]|nr:penicillin-binding protein 2 [bacterium]